MSRQHGPDRCSTECRSDSPLWISTAVFSILLAAVFGMWYARERTLSIHTIVTTPRESFYWLTMLVTFALGTAVVTYLTKTRADRTELIDVRHQEAPDIE